MSVNPNWARWVFASVANHLKTVAGAPPAIVEGIEDRDEAFERSPDRCEIRITGPFTSEPSSGFYELEVFANVLVTSNLSHQKNGYDSHKYLGLFHEAMDQVIPVYKFGAELGDDPLVFVGCLSPRGKVSVYHFGQLEKSTRIKQGLVDAKYMMELSE